MAAYPHIEWLNLNEDGILVECAILKRDSNGNIYHFEVSPLDNIDKERLRNICMNRNAANFPLWDLMQQVTLQNGVNALSYFHQLVKVKTPQGIIMDPVAGRRGMSVNEQKAMADQRSTVQKRKDTMAANKAAAAQ